MRFLRTTGLRQTRAAAKFHDDNIQWPVHQNSQWRVRSRSDGGV